MPTAPSTAAAAPQISLGNLPLALYIHIPWCLRKCPYCDFNSRALSGPLPEKEYVDALLTDLEISLPALAGRALSSIFIGGGTPSLFAPPSIARLLRGIAQRTPLLPDAEVTLEANPGTFELERFEGFRAAGVTRLSVGIQSFSPTQLNRLGRIHNADEADAAAAAAAAIFPQSNLDLMFALPGQDVAHALADLRQALSHDVNHVSLYHLSIEPNTEFFRHPPQLPDEDLAADMESALRQELAAQAYEHYEVSAHARAGQRCRHNVNYWEFGDYLGLGAGAHSKLSFPDRVMRQARARNPVDYLRAVAAGRPVASERAISLSELVFEFVLNGLRLREGIAVERFVERTGLPTTLLEPGCRAARSRGLLEADSIQLRATPLGHRFLDDLVMLFLSTPAQRP